MTQAFNLSQFANKVNTSGQASLTTAVTGTLPIANGGTNNGSLAVTAGGVVYTDGSKLVNVGAGTSGQVLTSAGSSAPTWSSPAGGGIGGMTAYATAGSFTFTIPSGKTVIKATVTGGGGGGAYGGAVKANVRPGGGAGGTAIKYFTSVTPGNTIAVTVGAAGLGTNSNVSGGTGGTSSIASGTQTITTVSATGGAGGGGTAIGSTSVTPGVGGVGSGGDINLTGQTGGTGIYSSANIVCCGTGGASFWAGGGRGDNSASIGAQAGTNGSGGGGGWYSGNGANGGAGTVVFEY